MVCRDFILPEICKPCLFFIHFLICAIYHTLSLFQTIHCLLIELVRRLLNRQDGVAVVAVPLHTFVIHVAGVLHRDELFIHQCGDVLHHSVDGQSGGICDGVVAGMALVRAAILTAEQVSIDRDWSVTKIQEKEFIRQSEKISAFRR